MEVQAPDAGIGRRWLALILAAAVAIVAAGAAIVLRASDAIPFGPAGTRQYTGLPREHVRPGTTVAYNVRPPVGGDHWDIWQNCGIYDAPLRDEEVVHSLEHGAVWVTYRTDLPEADVNDLRDTVRAAYVGDERYVVLSPYEGQDPTVVASAWGRQLSLNDVHEHRLAVFLSTFAGGRQSPEKLLPCSGGVGKPLY